MEPRRRNIIVIVVVVVLVAAGVGGYFALQKSAVSATCGSNQRTTICVDQAELPDSLDPAVTFSTPGWAAVQQVYQGLVQYNGTSVIQFSGVLAKNWSVVYDPTTGFESYVFTLWTGAHFSNGDPYNAYVQWYSLYRSLLLAQGPQFILEENFYSTNFSTTSPLSYYSDLHAVQAANTTLANDLNSWNFAAPTTAEIAQMSEPAQSFQVISPTVIALHLGYGYLASNYTYLLAALSAPNSYTVDPTWVDANGGVQVAAVNDYLTTHTLGTGQYLLEGYNGVEGGGYTLVVNPSYWGAAAFATEPWDLDLQPANTTVDIVFQGTLDVTISDLTSGKVSEASFAYIGPSTVDSLQGHPNVVVQPLNITVSSTSGAWWVYLNQSVFPFNNLSVREAIASAINYTEIITEAFGGWARQWVGPVPPGYPYDNNVTAKEPYYAYNLAQAKQDIANSPCANNACKGTPINYAYLDIGADWAEMAEFLVTDLAQIGLTINALPISLPDLYVEQGLTGGHCASATTANGGPFYMGQEFYTADYVAPDDYTQNDAYSAGSANMCMAGFSNATVDYDVYDAASQSNPVNITADYTNITSIMYNNYTDIWTVIPTSFAVYNVNLHGVIINAMGSAEPYAILFNTQWLS